MGAIAGYIDDGHVGNELAGAARHIPTVRPVSKSNIGDDGLKSCRDCLQLSQCLVSLADGNGFEPRIGEFYRQDFVQQDLVLYQEQGGRF
jgi:hypothetical protein